MATPNWPVFLLGVLFGTAALLVLSWATARTLSAAGSPREVPVPTGGDLIANVWLTHGLLAVAIVGLVRYAAVPPATLGVSAVEGGQVVAGVALGAGLYLASEGTTAVADRLGLEYDDRLRRLLAPDGPAEWAGLLLVALPTVAAAEELLFRGVLVGALAAGFDLPVWALAVASSVLFGLGHGAQGRLGVAVTTALGLVLAAAFVVTGSLLAVAVAHYVVDVLEFVVRDGDGAGRPA